MWIKLMRSRITNSIGRLSIFALGVGILYPGLSFAQAGKKVKHEVEQGKIIEVDPYAPAPMTIKGWTEYDQPIPQGEQDPAHPWYPKGPFPYKSSWPRKNIPYTGQKLMVFSRLPARLVKHYNNATYAPKMNARGLIESTYSLNMSLQHYDDYNDVLTYSKKSILHAPVFTMYYLLLNPPELRALSSLNKAFNNAPDSTWKYPEVFAYVPYLRKVRRLAGGGKQDDILGYPTTYDDQGNREVWEETHELIGEDVLCEINYGKQPVFPLEDIVEHPKWPGTWGAGLNPYRADGCMEFWVVKSTHKNPNYYLSYRLTWIEKRTKISLREEQYDREGKLFRIHESGSVLIPPHPPHITQSGWGDVGSSFWDLKRNFYTFIWVANYITDRPVTIEDLTQSRMEQEYIWRDPLETREITKSDDFPPYIRLYPEKVSKYRNIKSISAGTMAQMRKHNAIWEKRGNIDLWKWIEYRGPRGDATPYQRGSTEAK